MSRSALRRFGCVAIENTFWTYPLVRQKPIRRFQRADVTRLFHEAVARGGFHRTRYREQSTVEPFISQRYVFKLVHDALRLILPHGSLDHEWHLPANYLQRCDRSLGHSEDLP